MGLYVGGERESINVLFTQIKNNGKEIKKNLEHAWKLGTTQKEIKKNFWEMLCPQHFYNIFTINHRYLVVIVLNLNLTLKLIFCPQQ